MTTYYLQSDGDRSVIHSEQLDGFSLRAQPIEAINWIAAKLAFGFELTAIQSAILQKTTS